MRGKYFLDNPKKLKTFFNYNKTKYELAYRQKLQSNFYTPRLFAFGSTRSSFLTSKSLTLILVVLVMEKFPEKFTPADVASRHEYEKSYKMIKEMTNFVYTLANATEKDTQYTYKITYPTVEMANQIIAKIRGSVLEGTRAFIRQYAIMANGICDINQLTEITFWFATDKFYNKHFNKNCNNIRQEIMQKIESADGPEYVFTMNGKCMSASMQKVQGELNAFGWKIEAYDHWERINDDYCMMKLTLSS